MPCNQRSIYSRHRIDHIFVLQQNQATDHLLPQFRLQLIVMFVQKTDQVGRKICGEFFVAIGDMRHEVDMLSKRLDGGGVARVWVHGEDGICRFVLVVLVYKVVSI